MRVLAQNTRCPINMLVGHETTRLFQIRLKKSHREALLFLWHPSSLRGPMCIHYPGPTGTQPAPGAFLSTKWGRNLLLPHDHRTICLWHIWGSKSCFSCKQPAIAWSLQVQFLGCISPSHHTPWCTATSQLTNYFV